MVKERFSLLAAIRSAAENKPLSDAAAAVVEEGRQAAQRSGVNISGQIQIALDPERRYEGTPEGILASQNTEAATHGGEAVPTDLYDVIGPLRDRLVASRLGARMLSLTGNVDIPVYSGANCTWESEIGQAKDGAGTFSKISLSPKRLTAKLAVSKQFLIQTSASAEALIRQDLVDCIAEKLQQTMFGKGAGSNTEPAGLFNGVGADFSADFASIVEMEQKLEEANVYGEKKFLLSPSAKAALRTTPIDAGSGLMVMDRGEVLGIPAESTSSVVKDGLILGDWSNLYIANFGALDITVDPYSLADKAQVLLVVNAWFDYAVTRPDAFVKHILASD